MTLRRPNIRTASELKANFFAMLKHFSRFRRLCGGLAVVGVLVAAGGVTASVASPGRVLALPGATESSLVTVEPTRVFDTRSDIGLSGVFEAGVSRKLTITGGVVPVGATGVLMNVTAVRPTGAGFLSVRPGDATGAPSTSNLNVAPGDVVPNQVTVAIPTTGANKGTIDITYGSAPGNTVDIIVDVVGYTTNAGLLDLVNRVAALETADVGTESPAGVIWVAADGTGDYLLLSDALAAIGGQDETRSGGALAAAPPAAPYVIKIAPGTYTEPTPVVLKDYVDVEGSGQGITIINCDCSSNVLGWPSAVLSADAITAEIRHLTINNTGGGNNGVSFGVHTTGVINGSFSMLHVTVTATRGDGLTVAVYNQSSSPSMYNVTATAFADAAFNIAVLNADGSSPWMNNVMADAAEGTINFGVQNVGASSPWIRNSLISGATSSINNSTADSSAQVFGTGLGNYVTGDGSFGCVGAWAFSSSESLGPLEQDCQFPF